MNTRLLIMLLALLLAACGSAPLAEPPVYPDATPAARGESPLADAMMSGFTTEIVGERDAAAIRLFRAPGSIAWEQVKQFYAGRLEPNGWRADARLLVEGDTISYAGWRTVINSSQSPIPRMPLLARPFWRLPSCGDDAIGSRRLGVVSYAAC